MKNIKKFWHWYISLFSNSDDRTKLGAWTTPLAIISALLFGVKYLIDFTLSFPSFGAVGPEVKFAENLLLVVSFVHFTVFFILIAFITKYRQDQDNVTLNNVEKIRNELLDWYGVSVDLQHHSIKEILLIQINKKGKKLQRILNFSLVSYVFSVLLIVSSIVRNPLIKSANANTSIQSYPGVDTVLLNNPIVLNKPIVINKGSTPQTIITYITINNIYNYANNASIKFTNTVVDTQTGEFKLYSHDFQILDTVYQGKKKEDVDLVVKWGYDYERMVTRYPKGEYKTASADSVIGLLVAMINSLLKNNVSGTSNICGYIWGYADAVPVQKGTFYNFDLGFIENEKLSIRSGENYEHVKEVSRTLKYNITPLSNNDYAFLRAYSVKDSIIKSTKYVSQIGNINPDSIKIYTSTTNKRDSTQRRVDIRLKFEGILKHAFDSVNAAKKRGIPPRT